MSGETSDDSVISELEAVQTNSLSPTSVSTKQRGDQDVIETDISHGIDIDADQEIGTRCRLHLNSIGDLGTNFDGPSTDLESVTTLSQTEEIEFDSTFKKLPELKLAYSRKRTPDGKRRNQCLGCAKQQLTNGLQRLVSHALKCPNVRQDVKDILLSKSMILDKHYTTQDAKLNLLFAEVIVGGNLPFSIVSSVTFKQFVREALPDWKVDDRHTYSNTHIARLANLAETNFRRNLQLDSNKYLSLEFDHWSEATKRSLLGMVLTSTRGDRYLLDLKDVSLEGKTAAAIVDSLKVALSSIPSSNLNSIISDSDSACKKAREMIVQLPDWQHLIQHRCIAHLLNRLGNLFTKDASIEETITWATQVSVIASNCPKILEKIRQAGGTRVVKGGNTRWYSNADMLDSLIRNQDVIVEEIIAGGNPKRIELITQDDHWAKVEQASKLMRPIADCIAVSERKNGSLGEAVKALLELGKMLFDMDWRNSLVVAAGEAFLTYISINKLGEGEFGLLLASYILDPRYKLNYMTEDGIDLALKIIINIAESKNKFSKRTIATSLIPEFQSYCAFEGKYSKIITEETDVLSWWSTLHDCGSLGEVACRIAALRSSSSNIERTFSTLKLIQGYSRMNFALKTLKNLAKIRFSQKEAPQELLYPESPSFDGDRLSSSQKSVSEDSFGVPSLVHSLPENSCIDGVLRARYEALTNETSRSLLESFTKFIDYAEKSSVMSNSQSEHDFINLEFEITKARSERERRKRG